MLSHPPRKGREKDGAPSACAGDEKADACLGFLARTPALTPCKLGQYEGQEQPVLPPQSLNARLIPRHATVMTPKPVSLLGWDASVRFRVLLEEKLELRVGRVGTCGDWIVEVL